MIGDNLYIKSYFGMGDNIYMRPFIIEATKRFQNVYFRTPFPEFFWDRDNILFVQPDCGKLKTQKENVTKTPDSIWADSVPDNHTLLSFNYNRNFPLGKTVMESFAEQLPGRVKLESLDFTLPINPRWIKKAQSITSQIRSCKPICLIKYPTIKEEWKIPARNPEFEYFNRLIAEYKDQFYFISLADCRNNLEWFVGEPSKYIQKCFHNGELDIETILGLVALSDEIIGYPSFILPMAIALNKRAFFIYGGLVSHNLLTDSRIMNLNNIGFVEPEPFCNCFNPKHECNKKIEEGRLLESFKQHRNKPLDLGRKYSQRQSVQDAVSVASGDVSVIAPSGPKTLLISRLRASRCEKLAQNPKIKDNFKIVTIDHYPTREYTEIKGRPFEASYRYDPYGTPESWEATVREVIQKHNVTHAIIAQKEEPKAEATYRACTALNVKSLWCEAFFGEKLIYDYTGLQYTCPNDIYKFASKVPMCDDITLPQETRETQPPSITRVEFFRKYNLNPQMPYIVLFGQLPWDMSLKFNTNTEINSYDAYIHLVVNNNRDTIFLYKPHPKLAENKGKKYWEMYKNVVRIDESLDTLFGIFDYFTSYSSTTILEGIIRNKRFATIGFHFCNSDKLVHQLRKNTKASNLYKTLSNLHIDQEVRKTYLNFICNYYTLSFDSPRLYDKLIETPEVFYSKQPRSTE